MGGVQIGYNWQVNNFVFGMEGMIFGFDNKGFFVNIVFGVVVDDVFFWCVNMFVIIVGCVGFVVQNNFFYVKGGYVGVNNCFLVIDIVGLFMGLGGQIKWYNGWIVGVGWEYGIICNWIVGFEYNYVVFSSQIYQFGGMLGNYIFDIKLCDVQWVVVCVSYKFDGFVIVCY